MNTVCKGCWCFNECDWYRRYLKSEHFDPIDMMPVRCYIFIDGEDDIVRSRHGEVRAWYDTKDGIR